jgi:uncharacterized repeat protein (TIGR01451 family)
MKLFLSLLLMFGSVSQSWAQGANITVTCPQNGPECVMAPNPGDPLFYETNMLPGDTVTRTLTVINEDPDLACNLEVTAYNDRRSPTESDFPTKLESEISKDGSAFWNGTIQDVYDQQQIDLTTVPAGGSVVYDWRVTFDPNANNYYQLNETIFDFDVVFSCGDESMAKLQLSKTNNRLGLDNSPGDEVIYTLKVTAVTDVGDVQVTDLPPQGFVYKPGSWTGVTDEPSYHSPGVWKLGDMVAGEVKTLTYVAEIGKDQRQGVYPDLAWAEGVDADNQTVRANLDSGYFVGTEVKVVTPVVASSEYSVGRGGQVLGATTLPATGLPIIYTLVGLALLLIGLVGVSKFRITSMLVIAVLLGGVSQIRAADLSIRLAQPSSPTNQKELSLSFVVLDLGGKPVLVQCYKQEPGEAGFEPFGSAISIMAGGTSGTCPETNNVLSDNGTYQFKAVADNGVEIIESLVTTVKYLTDSPDKPSYQKSRKDQCSYLVEFTTANDGKTQKVELYRSEEMSFRADEKTKIASLEVKPNQHTKYEDTPPDCQKEYYYALRAIATSGSTSGLVGDEEIMVESQDQPPATTIPARRVTKTTVNPPPPPEPGLVLGEQSTESAETNNETESIPVQKSKLSWWWMAGVAFLVLVMGGILLKKKL